MSEEICEDSQIILPTDLDLGYNEDKLTKELETLLNCHCAENPSNTPDFILAQFMMACLAAFNIAIQQREGWYGRDPRPSL